jgi:hypothetical protein
MRKGILAAVFLLVLGPAYSAKTIQTTEKLPPVLSAENVQSVQSPVPPDEDSLLDRQVHERLEQFIENAEQKKYAERLEKFSENEWDAAGWYLFMLNQVVDEGEGCDYLEWYDKPLRISALDVLELEIETFLAEHE